MDPQNVQMKPKSSAKDVFLHLGAIVALFTVVSNLVNLLFTAIDKAYPQITAYATYSNSGSISFPVATLIIFFPIYGVLMWLIQGGYTTEPDKRQLGVRKWLTYVTLFIAGLILAGDLVYVLYEFIDGQELTAGFLLKALVLFIIIFGVFMYYISDIREKIGAMGQKVWFVTALVVVAFSIIWGFAVLGSPRTQQLIKYDEQKVSNLQQLNNAVQLYYQMRASLPDSLDQIQSDENVSNQQWVDPQTKQPYEYILVGQSAKAYQLCATFNEASQKDVLTYPVYSGSIDWTHPAGHYCFNEAIPVSEYPNVPATGPTTKAVQ